MLIVVEGFPFNRGNPSEYFIELASLDFVISVTLTLHPSTITNITLIIFLF